MIPFCRLIHVFVLNAIAARLFFFSLIFHVQDTSPFSACQWFSYN